MSHPEDAEVIRKETHPETSARVSADEELWDHGHDSTEELIDAHHGVSL